MKKILFCLQTMVMGGVEKELITILNKFDYSQYDVTLLLAYESDKTITAKIPKAVKVQIMGFDRKYYFSNLNSIVFTRIKKRKLLEAVKVAFYRLFLSLPCSETISFKELPAIDGDYDIAVCYHVHSGLMIRYVAEKVQAAKKIAWIHNDFSSTKFQIEKYNKSLSSYDSFVAVSSRVAEEFKERLPLFADKLQVVYNYLDSTEIIEKSQETIKDNNFNNDKRIKLVTVGRICSQKGYDLAALACKKIINDGFDISWYMIGGGDDSEIKSLINKLELIDNYILLGKKENPYPYINAADLYVQPSRHEAFCLTVEEAVILNKVVICTNFAGSDEQILDGINGIIVKSFDYQDIADAIEKVLCNDALYKRLSANTGYKIEEEQMRLKKIQSVFSV